MCHILRYFVVGLFLRLKLAKWAIGGSLGSIRVEQTRDTIHSYFANNLFTGLFYGIDPETSSIANCAAPVKRYSNQTTGQRWPCVKVFSRDQTVIGSKPVGEEH